MALNVPGGFMHVVQPFSLEGSGKVFSVTYGIIGGANPELALEQLEVADGIFTSVWKATLDDDFAMLQATGYYTDTGGDVHILQSPSSPIQGEEDTDTPPPNVTTAISKRTGLAGRSNRGRVFMPGVLAEGSVDEVGRISPTPLATLQSAANDWLTGLDEELPNGDGMWLFHNDDNLAPTRVTSLYVQPIVRTQRRRLARV